MQDDIVIKEITNFRGKVDGGYIAKFLRGGTTIASRHISIRLTDSVQYIDHLPLHLVS